MPASAGRSPATARTPALDAGQALERLATYPYQILTFVDIDGYPVSVAVEAAIDAPAGSVSFAAPAGLAVPTDADISLTGSHIHPQPGYGYDERRHVTVWGRATTSPDGRTISLAAGRAWGWDEAEVPFFEYSERSVGQSKKYFDALSLERGTPVKPRLSIGSLVLRTTRLPFLSATIVPVLLGIVIAARQGSFDLLTAVLTVIGAAFVQLAINVSNDVFDSTQGADDANVTPTKYSGGSRVIQYGLVSFRRMVGLATAFYLAAGAIGLLLLVLRGSPALLAIGVVGFIVGLGYTAPPLTDAVTACSSFGDLLGLTGNVLDLEVGPNGDIFYADFDGGRIRRITYQPVGNQAPDRAGHGQPDERPGAADRGLQRHGLVRSQRRHPDLRLGPRRRRRLRRLVRAPPRAGSTPTRQRHGRPPGDRSRRPLGHRQRDRDRDQRRRLAQLPVRPDADDGRSTARGRTSATRATARTPPATATPSAWAPRPIPRASASTPRRTCTTPSPRAARASSPTSASTRRPAALGSVIFQVYTNGTLRYTSPVLTGASATQSVNLAITGSTDLRLAVQTDGSPDFDHADWANARITCGASGNQAPPRWPRPPRSSGPAPLTVAFSGTGSSDPNGDTLTYAWDLDADGAYDDSTSATPSRIVQQPPARSSSASG